MRETNLEILVSDLFSQMDEGQAELLNYCPACFPFVFTPKKVGTLLCMKHMTVGEGCYGKSSVPFNAWLRKVHGIE